MKNFLFGMLAVVGVLAIPAIAMAQAAAGGVGVGITAGTYSAHSQSGGAVGGVIIGGQVGTFSQTASNQSYASAGMAIGAAADTTLHFASDGLNNGSIGVTRSSQATIEGFGTTGSMTTISYEGDGFQAGLGAHAAFASGDADANGAFLGIGIIGAIAQSP